MPNKSYKIPKNPSKTVSEPATAYQRQPATAEISSSDEWNPNVPFHGTQEEWWEHFRRIEEGNFSTWEEHQKRFDAWKKEYLANRM
ncbi:MAG: hypothetical protein FWF53_03095 [Candidatus Azobacteroides sp.]|nr:hypothetical protein [Candidatus Azobacteroides sp.]